MFVRVAGCVCSHPSHRRRTPRSRRRDLRCRVGRRLWGVGFVNVRRAPCEHTCSAQERPIARQDVNPPASRKLRVHASWAPRGSARRSGRASYFGGPLVRRSVSRAVGAVGWLGGRSGGRRSGRSGGPWVGRSVGPSGWAVGSVAVGRSGAVGRLGGRGGGQSVRLSVGPLGRSGALARCGGDRTWRDVRTSTISKHATQGSSKGCSQGRLRPSRGDVGPA